jgi:nitrite reductase/ring-hydroxylating ferredoxin subunit
MGNMPLIRVGALSDLPENSVMELSVGDNFYAICNVDGQITALNGVCPHQGGPLGQGNITGGRLMCPWHAWEFDCHTGINVDDPDERVPTYSVKVEGNEVFLQVP